MPPHLEEREKNPLGSVLQAIPLLMNFSLPCRYKTLSQISLRTVFGVQNAANPPIAECRYHHTAILPHGGERMGITYSYFSPLSFVFGFRGPLAVHHFITLLVVFRYF